MGDNVMVTVLFHDMSDLRVGSSYLRTSEEHIHGTGSCSRRLRKGGGERLCVCVCVCVCARVLLTINSDIAS
jgi:hypothetical protein